MRIIAEQQIPTDLNTLRQFVNKATELVEADLSAYVSYADNWLRVCSSMEDTS